MNSSHARFAIDRFEETPAGRVAVLIGDDGAHRDVAATKLPKGATEGTCVAEQADGSYAVDADETARRLERIRAKMDSLFVD